MNSSCREANFDGLVGPTHHHGGLARGNLSATGHRGRISSPRAAALQGLRKMKRLAELGILQGVLPPAPRPDWALLSRCGFAGSPIRVIEQAAREAPRLLQQAYSAASMWAANAATVIPSADSLDGRVHFVPANLQTMLHRAGEAEFTRHVLEQIFADGRRFAVHPPLPAHADYADEGAANHMRLAPDHDAEGLHVFVHGSDAGAGYRGRHRGKFPARQTRSAHERLTRLLRHPERALLVRLHPRAIERGVFHNDVIAMSHLEWVSWHEGAYRAPARLRRSLERLGGDWLRLRVVRESEVTLDEAVRSYLFNSQLVRPEGARAPVVLAPEESRESPPARALLENLVAEGWAERVEFIDLRQSMRNGGGPACLRLRVVLNEAERTAVGGRVWLDDALYGELTAWVERHYRERLAPEDLADPELPREAGSAQEEVMGILRLRGFDPGESFGTGKRRKR